MYVYVCICICICIYVYVYVYVYVYMYMYMYMYTVYCILYTVYCILYTVYCILYTVYCILYMYICICICICIYVCMYGQKPALASSWSIPLSLLFYTSHVVQEFVHKLYAYCVKVNTTMLLKNRAFTCEKRSMLILPWARITINHNVILMSLAHDRCDVCRDPCPINAIITLITMKHWHICTANERNFWASPFIFFFSTRKTKTKNEARKRNKK